MIEAQVLTCQAAECSYNCEMECCAPAIEVGDDHPMCDMFTTNPVNTVSGEPPIAMCKVSDCHFNSSTVCGASGVTMMRHSNHADCGTFRQ